MSQNKRISFNKEAHKEQFKRVSLPQKAVNFAVSSDEKGSNVQGYVTVWDVLSSDRGGYLVRFPAGSMVLPDYDVVMYYNHNDDYLLARESNNTLSISTDEQGVKVTGKLDDTFIDEYVKTKVANQTINGMSAGLYVLQCHDESQLITLADASGNPDLTPLVGQTVPVIVYDQWLLDECTITGRPALPQTSVNVFSSLVPTKDETGKSEDEKEKGEGTKAPSLETYRYEVDLLDLDLDD